MGVSDIRQLVLPETTWTALSGCSLSDDGETLLWPFDRKDERMTVHRAITYDPSGADGLPHFGLLTDFIDLVDAEPETFLRFAQKWGPLYFCEHGLPETHLPDRYVRFVRADVGTHHLRIAGAWGHSESVGQWRMFAKHATVLLKAGQDVHFLHALDADTMSVIWEIINLGKGYDLLPGVGPVPEASSEFRAHDAQLVSMALNMWLIWGDVRIVYVYDDGSLPKMAMSADSLFGSLALLIALVSVGARGISVCSGCGHPFTSKRRGTTGKNTYCGQECRKGEDARYQRKRRREKKAAKNSS